MNPQGTPEGSGFRTLTVLAVTLLIVSPLLYLTLVYVLKTAETRPPNQDLTVTYLLMAAAVLTPLIIPVVQRFFINGYKQNTQNRPAVAGAATSLFIIKMALVEASYVYGLVVFFVTRQIDWLWFFYVVGIIWTLFIWPTRERYEETIRQLEAV